MDGEYKWGVGIGNGKGDGVFGEKVGDVFGSGGDRNELFFGEGVGDGDIFGK